METSTVSPLSCPHCSSHKVVGFGYFKGQEITDVPKMGTPTVITIDRKRYRCSDCGKTFLERLDYVDGNRSITRRLVAYIERQCLSRPFLEISKEVGLAESTIRSIFSEYTSRLEVSLPSESPDRLAVDEIRLVNRPRYLITNIDKQTIIDIIEGNSYQAASRHLGRLGGKQSVKVFLMGPFEAIRLVAKNAFPKANITLDKHYLLETVLQLLEGMRQSVRKKLAPNERRLLVHDQEILRKRYADLTDQEKDSLRVWEKSHKKLVVAYWLKESFFELFDNTDHEKFFDDYLKWEKDVYADCFKEFEPLLKLVDGWRVEGLYWFYHKFPERRFVAIKELSEAMKGMDRGHSFKAVRTKILGTENARTRDGISIAELTKIMKGSEEEDAPF